MTVCGENEPVAYVTEYFLGDGVMTVFNLAADPYFPPASKSTVISELFNEAQINETVWGDTGGLGYMTIGPSGLTMNGGNGIDGQTLLEWIDPIEMAGTLLLETVGVALAPGSTGILAGFFSGLMTAPNCIAGLQATAAIGHRSGDAAADRAGYCNGNAVRTESGDPIHASSASALPGE
ncbi:MAG: hypothetical protein WDM87_07795 [Terracidiphilus sp.]